jgi:hypothetical protein
MKHSCFFLAIFLVGIASCKTSDKKNPSAMTDEQRKAASSDTSRFTRIEWIDPVVQPLGKLKKDQSIEITYRFRNAGQQNLIIENVSAQCGCTIPSKPEEPIAPGAEGIIRAKFNGSGSGTISKQIYVRANTKPDMDHTLTFTGEIQE